MAHHQEPGPASSPGISRRTFIIRGGALLIAGPHLLPLLSRLAEGAEETGLIVRTRRPENYETPLSALRSWLTPNDLFYVRSHYDTPQIAIQDWTLQVDGEVDRPMVLRMEDLLRFEKVTIANTLECAGNGRAFFTPKTSGVQWEYGAVGNARWGGVRLADVLRKAGVRASGRHVMLDGADRPPLPTTPDFIRSIPIEKALDPNTLLAYEMNGQPLPPRHGFPLRAIVPGWYGMASCKWLTTIRVLDQEDDGYFMKTAYRIPRGDNPNDTVGLTEMGVKSVITKPLDGERVKAGTVEVKGAAWAGEAEIVGVDLSTDGGKTWRPVRLMGPRERFAWRIWEFTWEVKQAGPYTLMARATDSRGRVQPGSLVWNPGGYANTVIHAIQIAVEEA